MGLRLADIEIGKEYRSQYARGEWDKTTTYRLRADAIEQVEEETYDSWTGKKRPTGRKVRKVLCTPLDETTGEVLTDVEPEHVLATQLLETWEDYAERQAAADAAEHAHDALVQRLDGAFGSVAITAVRYGEARYTEAPSIAIVLTHEMAEKLAKVVES